MRKLRVQMRAEIARLQHGLGVTTIYVTHDQTEAMTMGDRVAVLKDGVLQQVDTPTGIYHGPANTFVASFIGSPTMNLYHAETDGRSLRFGSSTLDLPKRLLPGSAATAGGADFRDPTRGHRGCVGGRRSRDPGREFTGPVELFEELGSDTWSTSAWMPALP